MLILSRKKDEKLMIGNEIEVQIVKIDKDSVRIGIKAPCNVSVHRYEVYESIREEPCPHQITTPTQDGLQESLANPKSEA